MSVVGGQQPWKPWASDAESFERAVLADLEQRVGGHTPELMREDADRDFRGARLDGSYPNTAVVVSYLNLKSGRVEESRWPVWEERYVHGKRMEDPQSIAQGIWVWLIEPLGPNV
jgi:hypothetical protein